MIPYFFLDHISLGPLTMYTWGLFAAIGFLVGIKFSIRQANLLGFNGQIIWDLAWRVVIWAMLGARLFEILFYDPGYYWQNPSTIVNISAGGLSVYGGIIGGAITTILFLRKHNLRIGEWLDVLAPGTALGIMFGRIGCFFIHDHPGIITNFPWGVRFPEGIVRHDLGLEMAVIDFIVFLLLWMLSVKKLSVGTVALWFIFLKGLSRLAMDFVRAYDGPLVDSRYWLLTPAQYLGLLSMVIVGIIMFYRQKRLV